MESDSDEEVSANDVDEAVNLAVRIIPRRRDWTKGSDTRRNIVDHPAAQFFINGISWFMLLMTIYSISVLLGYTNPAVALNVAITLSAVGAGVISLGFTVYNHKMKHDPTKDYPRLVELIMEHDATRGLINGGKLTVAASAYQTMAPLMGLPPLSAAPISLNMIGIFAGIGFSTAAVVFIPKAIMTHKRQGNLGGNGRLNDAQQALIKLPTTGTYKTVADHLLRTVGDTINELPGVYILLNLQSRDIPDEAKLEMAKVILWCYLLLTLIYRGVYNNPSIMHTVQHQDRREGYQPVNDDAAPDRWNPIAGCLEFLRNFRNNEDVGGGPPVPVARVEVRNVLDNG